MSESGCKHWKWREVFGSHIYFEVRADNICWLTKRGALTEHLWEKIESAYLVIFNLRSIKHLSGEVLGVSQVVLVVKNPPWVGKIPWRRAWQPTLVFLPGDSPWTAEPGRLQSMWSQRLPMDCGTWQATVHVVTKSQTWLKRLSIHAWHREVLSSRNKWWHVIWSHQHVNRIKTTTVDEIPSGVMCRRQGNQKLPPWKFFFFFFFYCSGFCHTLKWISHGFTCVPHPDPPSHLPLHPIPLGLFIYFW